MQKKVVLKIFGRVQNVLYRANTMNMAKKLDLTGCVQNKLDKTVEIIAEGEKDNLKKLITWCYRGSSNAKVENIIVSWKNYTGGFNSFEIKH